MVGPPASFFLGDPAAFMAGSPGCLVRYGSSYESTSNWRSRHLVDRPPEARDHDTTTYLSRCLPAPAKDEIARQWSLLSTAEQSKH